MHEAYREHSAHNAGSNAPRTPSPGKLPGQGAMRAYIIAQAMVPGTRGLEFGALSIAGAHLVPLAGNQIHFAHDVFEFINQNIDLLRSGFRDRFKREDGTGNPRFVEFEKLLKQEGNEEVGQSIRKLVSSVFRIPREHFEMEVDRD